MKKDSKKLILRLNRIEGQIRGLKKMVEDGTYCIDVITQTSAVKSALSAFEDKLLQDHLEGCVVDQVEKGKKKQAIEEMMKVYKLKRK